MWRSGPRVNTTRVRVYPRTDSGDGCLCFSGLGQRQSLSHCRCFSEWDNTKVPMQGLGYLGLYQELGRIATPNNRGRRRDSKSRCGFDLIN